MAQGKQAKILSEAQIRATQQYLCLANSYYLCKSPSFQGTSKNDATAMKLGRSRGSRGSGAGFSSGFSVFSGFPAGLFPSHCGLQADSFPECRHVGAAATRRSSCTRRRML